MASVGVVLLLLIGFVEKRHHDKVINHVEINLAQEDENYFIDQNDILKMLTESNAETVIGASFESIDLKAIENRIENNKFVNGAEVFKDLKGNLVINVSQRRPIARIIRATAADAYVANDGMTFPTSLKYTARVLLVSGAKSNELLANGFSESEYGKQLLTFLQFVEQSPFWKAEIAQAEIAKDGDITLYPQIGRQVIDFGQPENIEDKFKRLDIFFKKILPVKGWNYYQKVSIKYNNQIVCE